MLTGVALVFGYALLGAGWLILKTEGTLQDWARRLGRIAQLGARREKEEGSPGAVRDAELAQRLHHRMHAAMVGRYGEHAKGFPSELPLVLFRGMGRQVRAPRGCSGMR